MNEKVRVPAAGDGDTNTIVRAASNTPRGRDLRLDLFRGLANWAIFLDHIPNNAVAWLTTWNYGFSDAADIFVFISGYTAAFVYGRRMERQDFIAGTALVFRRVWQFYVAHMLLFVFYAASIGYVAQRYGHSHLLDELNVSGLIEKPVATLSQGLTLAFKPLNLDVLPLYIVLMAAFPPMLWSMMCFPMAALRLRWGHTFWRATTDGICPLIPRAVGTSIRSPGSSYSPSGHGRRWAGPRRPRTPDGRLRSSSRALHFSCSP